MLDLEGVSAAPTLASPPPSSFIDSAAAWYFLRALITSSIFSFFSFLSPRENLLFKAPKKLAILLLFLRCFSWLTCFSPSPPTAVEESEVGASMEVSCLLFLLFIFISALYLPAYLRMYA